MGSASAIQAIWWELESIKKRLDILEDIHRGQPQRRHMIPATKEIKTMSVIPPNVDYEGLMREWDYWRGQIAGGSKASAPRDWFENVIEYVAECCIAPRNILDYLATFEGDIIAALKGEVAEHICECPLGDCECKVE